MGKIQVGQRYRDLRAIPRRWVRMLKHTGGMWIYEEVATGHVSHITGRNLLRRFVLDEPIPPQEPLRGFDEEW